MEKETSEQTIIGALRKENAALRKELIDAKHTLAICNPRYEKTAGAMVCQFCDAGPNEQHKPGCHYKMLTTVF